MVGKSTLGRSLTGSVRYPITPNRTIPSMTKVVMTGRRIKISLMLIVRWRGRLGGAVDILLNWVAGAYDVRLVNRRRACRAHHFPKLVRHRGRTSKSSSTVDDTVRDPQRRPPGLIFLIPDLDPGPVVDQVLRHRWKLFVSRGVNDSLSVLVHRVHIAAQFQRNPNCLERFRLAS